MKIVPATTFPEGWLDGLVKQEKPRFRISHWKNSYDRNRIWMTISPVNDAAWDLYLEYGSTCNMHSPV